MNKPEVNQKLTKRTLIKVSEVDAAFSMYSGFKWRRRRFAWKSRTQSGTSVTVTSEAFKSVTQKNLNENVTLSPNTRFQDLLCPSGIHRGDRASETRPGRHPGQARRLPVLGELRVGLG